MRLPARLCCSLCLWSVLAAAEERAITLLSPDARHFTPFPEAEERLGAELSAAGFSVQHQRSRARSERELLAELQAAPTFGSVTVLLRDGLGVGYVWLGARAEPQRVLRDEADAHMAADLLALSVVELLNSQGLAIELPPEQAPAVAQPTRVRERPIAAPATAPPSPRRWQLSADVGPAISPGMSRMGGALGAAAQFSPLRALKLELALRWMLLDATTDTPAGTAEIAAWDVRAYALWAAVHNPRFEWDLGAGAGPFFARADALARAPFEATTDSTTTLVLSARSRLAWWLAPELGLFVVAEPGILVPALEISVDARGLVVLGRPWLNVGLGVVLAI